jgi:uncharacterized protein (TIGR00369 family)
MNETHPRRQMTGLEYFRRIMAGEIPHAPFVAGLGIRFAEVERGRVVVEVEPAAAHENGLGIAHGGLAATLLDTALGCAVNTVMTEGQIFTTLEMQVHYTRAIRQGLGVLRCEATIVHAGRRTATAEARIVDSAGKLYAHGTGTWIAFEGAPRT